MKNQQFTVAQYADAKVVAKELGINPVGKTKETLVNLVNEKLAAQKAPKEKVAKWFANGYGFEAGQTVSITSKTINKSGVTKEILQGREAVVIGPSSNEGQIKAYLIDEKSGQTLNCPITLEIDKINLVEKASNEVA